MKYQFFFYYKGAVVKNKDARNVEVKFQSLGKLKVASRFVIATSGAKAMPRLKVSPINSKFFNNFSNMFMVLVVYSSINNGCLNNFFFKFKEFKM